jgi:hypothetical protein
MDQPSGPESDDPVREARAYAWSIYLMAGMPYLLLGVLGTLFYRSVKKAQRKAEAERASVSGPASTTPGAPGTLPT